jgi:hypothetical protein
MQGQFLTLIDNAREAANGVTGTGACGSPLVGLAKVGSRRYLAISSCVSQRLKSTHSGPRPLSLHESAAKGREDFMLY